MKLIKVGKYIIDLESKDIVIGDKYIYFGHRLKVREDIYVYDKDQLNKRELEQRRIEDVIILDGETYSLLKSYLERLCDFVYNEYNEWF